MSVGRHQGLPEDGTEGGTEIRMSPVGNGRWAEERWVAKRRSGSPEWNARNHYTLKIKD